MMFFKDPKFLPPTGLDSDYNPYWHYLTKLNEFVKKYLGQKALEALKKNGPITYFTAPEGLKELMTNTFKCWHFINETFWYQGGVN